MQAGIPTFTRRPFHRQFQILEDHLFNGKTMHGIDFSFGVDNVVTWWSEQQAIKVFTDLPLKIQTSSSALFPMSGLLCMDILL